MPVHPSKNVSTAAEDTFHPGLASSSTAVDFCLLLEGFWNDQLLTSCTKSFFVCVYGTHTKI
ncbi:hypothetical protein pfor_33c3171 [Rhodobacteraceae bacterium SB2]|nr:hypothetical protein pfor_33c3171 [Rhodobacteraceae bacterium SB2]